MSEIYKRGRRYSSIIGERQPSVPVKKRFDALCSRFFCKIVNDAACCGACPLYLSCDFACLNSAEKCGLCIGPDDE